MNKIIEEVIKNTKTISSLEQIRNEVDEACKKQHALLENIENAKQIKSFSFGTIKNCFENACGTLFENGGCKYLQKYVSCVRENKDLAKMHLLYECIRKGDRSNDVSSYISETLNMIGSFDKENYQRGRNKLGVILSEAYVSYPEAFSDILQNEKTKLDEATEYIALNKKTLKNLAEYNRNIKVIREHIEQKEPENFITKHNTNIDEVVENYVKNFNGKYSGNIEDIALIKEISETKDKKEVFTKYQNKCFAKISEIRETFNNKDDKASDEKLSFILEKVQNKKYNPDTLGIDVCNFIELINCID